jgi:hypothetical protein
MGRYAGWSVVGPGSSSKGPTTATQELAEATVASNTRARRAAGVMSPVMNRLAVIEEQRNEFSIGIHENRSD